MQSLSRYAIPALVLITVLCYLGTFRNDFVDFDDDRYVTQNETVLQGLSWEGIVYAFTTMRTGNWIPLTWLSLQLDVSLFGLHPAGFHGMSLLLHLANVLLFFQLLRRIGGTMGVSFLAAALFSLHPLHVESVAWMSERKDVLSTFFLLLTFLFYVQYVERPSRRQYALVLVLLALGLMAKPMLVTVPVLFLLADLFLLNRCDELRPLTAPVPPGRTSFSMLCLEKIPLAMVVVATALVTVFAQKTDLAMVDFQTHPVSARMANAVCSTTWYLLKTFLPTGLCAFYPLNYGHIDWLATLWSGALLAGITAGAVSQWRRRPYVLFGWGWFLISLLPVIGLLQVGGQARADRFSYVPHLGLFLALVWLGAEAIPALLRRFFQTDPLEGARPVQWTLAGLILTASGVLTVQQVATWRDSATLWTRANQTQPNNWMAKFYLGQDQLRQHNWPAARDFARQSLDIRPWNADALALLGKTYLQEERWDYAQMSFHQALEINGKHRDSLIGLAAVAHGKHDFRDAERFLLLALELKAHDPFVRVQLGLLYAQTGHADAALEQFQLVTTRCPWHVVAWKSAGQLLARGSRFEEAIQHFEQATRLAPDDLDTLNALERLHRRRGDHALAETYATRAARFTPPAPTVPPRNVILQTSATQVVQEED